MKTSITILAARNGIFLKLPFNTIIGNSEVAFQESRYGIVRYGKHGRFHNWVIYLGKKEIQLFSPGEFIGLEEIDPYHKRYTREINFCDKTYTFHSGKRRSYYEKYPNEVTETLIWMPDLKHKNDPNVVSFGLTNIYGELIDPEAFMKEWAKFRKELRDEKEASLLNQAKPKN